MTTRLPTPQALTEGRRLLNLLRTAATTHSKDAVPTVAWHEWLLGNGSEDGS